MGEEALRNTSPPTTAAELIAILGASGQGLARSALTTQRPDELRFSKLLGESDDDARARHDKEAKLVYALVWEKKSVLEAAEYSGMSTQELVNTFDRVEVPIRIEHHIALKAALSASHGLDSAVSLLGSENESIVQKASNTLINAAGSHELFRSKVTAALTKDGDPGADLADPRIKALLEMLSEQKRIEAEVTQIPAVSPLDPGHNASGDE